MAIVQTDSVSLKKKIIEHLSENVNSADDDIAPTPFGDDILYFTNIINGKSKVLRSQQLSNDWSLAQQVENLPILPDVSFGNGAFSPDGSRFYYTQNQNGSIKKGKKTASYLYLITRTDKGWSAPIALPKALNTEGGITTHPFVFHKNDMEYLYFSSDRQGGQGGMDIWYSTRSLKNEAFSEAQNAGSIINTAGDDMTPYFDVEENTLYFASNGRATFGGLDIFKSKGSENRWVTPENIGMPFNSGADDWYYIKNKSKTGGFFVSNRALGVDKITSKDDDIYKFKINTQRELNIAGKVFEKESKALLENARVSLYERKGADNQRLLSSVMCSNGQFSFPILPQKAYILEIEKDAYRVTTFDFNTKDSLKSINRDFFLEKYKVLAAYKPEIPTSKYLENASAAVDVKKTKKNTLEKAVTTESSKTNITPKKTLPVAFKIQIIAYETLDNANRKRLARVDDLGELDTEKALVNGKNFTRVMLTNFNSYAEAVTVLKKVKDRSLTDAFIIRYENGKRTSKNR